MEEKPTSVCRYRGKLSSYYDGELPQSELVEIESHLADCRGCSAELEQLKRLSGLLRGAYLPAMPGGALARLHSRVGSAREAVVVRLAERLMAVAATVLVVCGLWLWQANGVRRRYDVSLGGWEIAAMTLGVEDAQHVSPEELLTQWIVTDLSAEEQK